MNELKQLRKMPAEVHQLPSTAANAIDIGNKLPSEERACGGGCTLSPGLQVNQS